MPNLRARIVQVSDLHVNRLTQPAVTDMLTRILRDLRADVLIVSGDVANQPVPWQMKRAARLVNKLKEACEPKYLIVIPGNHDVKFWGNLGLFRLTRIPFEVYFRRRGLEMGFWRRLVLSWKLGFMAIIPGTKALREPPTMLAIPELGLAISTINSNTLAEMMAAGKVEASDLQQLYALLDNATENTPGFSFFYKIAVVHHHPAPIADVPVGPMDRLQESFMVFYNAGLFVRELSRRNFNLILHGHKHVAGFVRLGFEMSDQGRKNLSVAAAGTAGHPKPDDSRGHHINVIDLLDDDTARLESLFFSASVQRQDTSYIYQLESIGDVRRRRQELFQRQQKHRIGSLHKHVFVTSSGYSDIAMQFLDCVATDVGGIDCIRVSLTTSSPTYLRQVRPLTNASALVRMLQKSLGLREYTGTLELGARHLPNTGSFQYGYQYRLMNAHVLTPEEFARHYSSSSLGSEFASITCEHDCGLLTLSVDFPDGYAFAGLQFHASAEYVKAPLTGVDDDRINRGESIVHDDETLRIKNSIQVREKGVALVCTEPVPGVLYKLCWNFARVAPTLPRNLQQLAGIRASQSGLVRLAERARAGDMKLWNQARAVLDSLVRDLKMTLQLDSPEALDVSIMVFDESSQKLKAVCSNTEPSSMPQSVFHAGEGCAGFVFEKARYLLYHAEYDQIGYFIRSSELTEGSKVLEPVVLASFPWFSASREEGSTVIVGVVNITSMLSTTKLLRILDLPDEEAAREMAKAQFLVNLAGEELLTIGLGES